MALKGTPASDPPWLAESPAAASLCLQSMTKEMGAFALGKGDENDDCMNQPAERTRSMGLDIVQWLQK